jgi:hypothetical protein
MSVTTSTVRRPDRASSPRTRSTNSFCVFVEKEVERVLRRHLDDEIDLDFERGDGFRKHEPRLVVAERILLPIDEMVVGARAKRVRLDARAAMRSGPQPDDVRRQRDGTTVAVLRDMTERDSNGQGA